MPLGLISPSQASKEVTANNHFVALQQAELFSLNPSTTSGLTFGYVGGNLMVGTTPTLIADGTLTLTNTATNYIESTTAGVVSSNTTAFTAGRIQLYIGVAAAGLVTYTDKRTSGIGGAATGVGGGSAPTGSAGGDLAGTYPNPTVKTSVSLTTPVLGVATATSVNKVTITTPTTSATLTLADGKTLTANNSLTLAGTDATTMTFPPASASVGYMNIPQNSQSVAYTTVLADQGKHILHPAADTTARTFTIDSNANVAYPVGTAITFVNENAAGVMTIAITTDTMRLAGAGTTGNRTLAANGVATALKLTSTSWIISGTGLT